MTIPDLLERSAATPAFREDLHRFLQDGRSGPRIVFDAGSPRVKVARVIAKALVEYPALPIESIEVRGRSGCESFQGHLTLHAEGGSRSVHFHWDCRWRAEQEGWYDCFGFPDQIRAAREFGFECFREWSDGLGAGSGAPELAATDGETVAA
jgi:hypothetical protein